MALSRPILALRNSENTQNDQIWNHKNHPAPWSQPAVTYTYGAPWLALWGRSSFRTLIRGVDIRRLMETCARKDLTCGESIKIPAGSVKKKHATACVCVKGRDPLLWRIWLDYPTPPPNSSSGHRHTPGSAPRSAAAAAHSLRCMEEREREREEREKRKRRGSINEKRSTQTHTSTLRHKQMFLL